MSDLNTSIPSTRWLQGKIQARQSVSVQLITSAEVTGTIKWLDPDCICVTDAAGSEVLLWRNAIASIRTP